VLSPSGEVVIGTDDTIERGWGRKIKARGIYREGVRVVASPLRQDQRFTPAVSLRDCRRDSPFSALELIAAVRRHIVTTPASVLRRRKGSPRCSPANPSPSRRT
jgi:hypothetical protein